MSSRSDFKLQLQQKREQRKRANMERKTRLKQYVLSFSKNFLKPQHFFAEKL